MTRPRSARDARIRRAIAVLDAYQRHHGSTTQRENAAADLGMDLATFRSVLEDARLHGFDIDRVPDGA